MCCDNFEICDSVFGAFSFYFSFGEWKQVEVLVSGAHQNTRIFHFIYFRGEDDLKYGRIEAKVNITVCDVNGSDWMDIWMKNVCIWSFAAVKLSSTSRNCIRSINGSQNRVSSGCVCADSIWQRANAVQNTTMFTHSRQMANAFDREYWNFLELNFQLESNVRSMKIWCILFALHTDRGIWEKLFSSRSASVQHPIELVLPQQAECTECMHYWFFSILLMVEVMLRLDSFDG